MGMGMKLEATSLLRNLRYERRGSTSNRNTTESAVGYERTF